MRASLRCRDPQLGLRHALPLVLWSALACSAEPRPPASAPAQVPAESSPAATAVTRSKPSDTASECDGVFIAPIRRCHRGELLPARERATPALRPPYILVFAKRLDAGLSWKIADRCIVEERQTVLPVDGLELELRLARGSAPEVVRADERLDVELMACAARLARASYEVTQTPLEITVVFFPGDLEDDGRTRLDPSAAPGIVVEFQKVGAPLTRAMALRLLRVNAGAMRACVESTYERPGRVSVVLEMSFGRDGVPYDVKLSSFEPEAAELATCIQRLHQRLTSTVFADDGSTTLRVKYWLRGSPNAL